MLVFLLLLIDASIIPEKFRTLADEALLNSTIKVPQNLREQTKQPGYYSYGNAHFTLFKPTTSSHSFDIKGYAIGNGHVAVVKRKKFNLNDGFILVDIQNQELYEMEKLVASDGKVNIYKAKPIDMFFVFSDIEFTGKTPLLSYKHNYNWNEKRNRPNLVSVGSASAGVGTLFSASMHSKVRFHSIKKAEISTDVTLNGKVGVEILLKKSNYEKISEIPLMDDIDVPIPGFGISFRFLGLRFEFGLFFTFGVILKDLEKCLQVDVDYFKGYQFTAKRYICIKRHGTTDTGWNTQFSSIPAGNLVEGTATNLESNYIKGVIQFNQGIKLKAVVAVIETSLSFGLTEPFKIEFGFAPLACPYPYLYGGFELPLQSYYGFDGVKIKIKLFGKRIKYTLLHSHYKYHYITHIIKPKKYCIFDSQNNNDYIGTEIDGGEDEDEDQYINETSDRILSLDAYDLENTYKTHTRLSPQISLSEKNSTDDKQFQLISRRAAPFEDITSQNNYFDTSIVAVNQSRLNSKVTFNFWYYAGTNWAKKSDDYSFLLKEYIRKDDGFTPIYAHNSQKTEGVGIKLRIKYCEPVQINEMYVPSMRLGVIDTAIEFGDKLCVIVKDLDENSTDYVDENTTFTTDGTLSQSLVDRGIFKYDDEFFQIQLNSVTLPTTPDSGTNVHYEICAEWGNDFQYKSLLISNFTTEFKKGKNIIIDDYRPKVKMNKDMRLFVVISYIYNYNILNLRQPIILSEVQKTAQSGTQTLTVIEPVNEISCECTFQRYVPIIRVNCSHENSTHRIITNAYELNSYRPSESKPQVIQFKEGQLYGVFQLKRIDDKVKSVIIHMPDMQPLCNFSQFSDDYYQIPFNKEVLYIPFRRENESAANVTIENIIQGTFIDDETIYLSNEYYVVDFDNCPIALFLVQTINNQYSITCMNETIQTLIDFGDKTYQLLALEYKKEKKVIVASSLIIIDENYPLAEKTIPNFPEWKSVIYHVWCQRADEILFKDKTTNITSEYNIEKDGQFFKLSLTPGHIIDFVPICTSNLSQPMCFFRQNITDPDDYVIYRFPNDTRITILDTNSSDLLKNQEGLIEEVMKTSKHFYYMTSSSGRIITVRIYKGKLDLTLRVYVIPGEYVKYCLIDQDGYVVPISRQYYTDDYQRFMQEYGVDPNDIRYIDFSSGTEDSCVYAYYDKLNSTDCNETDCNETDYNDIDSDDDYISSSNNLLLESTFQPVQKRINPSIKISEMAKSIKVSTYKDINYLIPPEDFYREIYSSKKLFEEDWLNDMDILDYEISEYFIRTKLRVKNEANNSIYALYLPYKEFRFNNSLKENEFISAKGNITIICLGKPLNYLLPTNYHTILDLGKSNEITLNLLGRGSLEFKTSGHKILRIKGTINLDSIKTIYVSNEIEQIEIENVNLAKYAELHALNSLNQKVKIKIANLTLLAHSNANLADLEITESIKIKQTATAIFDETVTVSEAAMIIEMIIYQNDLIPMVKGSLQHPPKSISILRSTENGPIQNEEYIILDGQFDCETLTERMSFNNSLFNTIRCTDNNNTNPQLLDSVQDVRAFVSFVKKETTVKKEIYWFPELIAMTVFGGIGCALLVIIIILIVILIASSKHGTGNEEP